MVRRFKEVKINKIIHLNQWILEIRILGPAPSGGCHLERGLTFTLWLLFLQRYPYILGTFWECQIVLQET